MKTCSKQLSKCPVSYNGESVLVQSLVFLPTQTQPVNSEQSPNRLGNTPRISSPDGKSANLAEDSTYNPPLTQISKHKMLSLNYLRTHLHTDYLIIPQKHCCAGLWHKHDYWHNQVGISKKQMSSFLKDLLCTATIGRVFCSVLI